MNQTSVLLFVAGATMSMGSALAQNAKFEAAKAETLADAATRTSYLAGGAGWNNGAFNINDGAGNNSLNIGGTIVTRYNLNFRSEDSVGDQDDMTIGFNMPYNRVRFWGNVGSKDIDYMIQLSSSDTSGGTVIDDGEGGSTSLPGGVGLEDAWGRYNFEGGASVTWGQFKLPLIRQVMVDNEFQLAMDRSVTSAVFTQGYSQGAMFTYAGEQFKISVAFSDGANTAGTDFNSDAEADFAVTGRVDFMAMGTNWNQFNDETSWKSNADGLLIGGALHYQTGGETGGTSDVDVFAYTIDASFESAGWNVTGAFMGNTIEPDGGESISNYGVFVQGGFFVTDQTEIFARGDGIFLDDALAAQDDNIWFITAGVNHYLFPESHAVKFTFQINYSLNDNTPLFATDGLVSDPTRYGYLGDSEDGEWGVGAQGQVRW